MLERCIRAVEFRFRQYQLGYLMEKDETDDHEQTYVDKEGQNDFFYGFEY